MARRVRATSLGITAIIDVAEEVTSKKAKTAITALAGKLQTRQPPVPGDWRGVENTFSFQIRTWRGRQVYETTYQLEEGWTIGALDSDTNEGEEWEEEWGEEWEEEE